MEYVRYIIALRSERSSQGNDMPPITWLQPISCNQMANVLTMLGVKWGV